MDSLKFLVEDGRIWLYGFVVMPNHVHLLWCKRDKWVDKNIQQQFLKYTAQQIKFDMINNQKLDELELYRSTQSDREFHFWERRPYKATMFNRKVADQKIDYIHYNPVKAGLCTDPEEYKYSSFSFYELNEDQWGFLTHYADHL
ncbi:MAG: transposase [Cyclobacteriaceae bacterium]|nr:transposase [Cyclobacteriaceae bacterium]